MIVLYCGRETRATIAGQRVTVETEAGELAVLPPAPGLLVLEASSLELAALLAAGFRPYIVKDHEVVN